MLFVSQVAVAEEDFFESEEAWMDDLLGLDSSDEEAGELDDLPTADELRQVLKKLLSWTIEGSLAGSVGRKNNVLYANDGGVDASYAQAEVDLFALRPRMGGRPKLIGVLYGEFRYFDGVPGLKDESMVTFYGASSWAGESGLETTLAFSAMRSDQAFDASVDEFVTETTSVVLWRPEFRMAFQKSFEGLGTFNFTPSYAQSQYNLSSEDYDTTSIRLDWSRLHGDYWKVRTQIEYFEKSYDGRLSYLSVGRLDEDSSLKIKGNRFVAELSYANKDGVLRKLRTRAMYEREDDAVGNYYERDRWQIRESAVFAMGKQWSLQTSLSYGNIDYASRLVSSFVNETRSDASWRWNTTLTRQMKHGIEGFLRVEGVDKKSNSTTYSYETSGIMLGMRFSGN